DVTLKMPAFEWVHVQLHQQKGMISLSPPTICNSACKTHGYLKTGYLGVGLGNGNFCTLSTLFNQFGYVSD
ncbi:hypothetical protein, partial [Salmonella enterica]|uniref:hypothetical protein n=1 Tax=Salmonella enterica TaxID=28901 RepID=UPI001CD6BDF7